MEKHNWHRVHLNHQSTTMPLPRWGHSSCVLHNQILIFGGYACTSSNHIESIYMNDLWSFNTITMEWKQIKTTGILPTPRSNSTMTYDYDNHRIILFGGGGPNKKRYNTINILDWITKHWIQIQANQNQPAPWQRTYHCAELLNPYLIIFGGECVTDMDDLWLFNFETYTWKQIIIDNTKPKPCHRRFHSSVLIGNHFYVIGGCYAKYRCLSDVFSLDLTPLLQDRDIDRLQWKDHKPIDVGFLSRWGHTSTVFDNKIYIFGGRFCNDLNDLLVLNVDKNIMKVIKMTGELPKARRRHSASFIGSSMIIFGGFNGQYFNDLHYLNLLDLKTLFYIPPTSYHNNLTKLINNQQLSDLSITTNKNQIFYLHKQLLANGLKNQIIINHFIQKINGNCTKQILYDLIQKIYRGYGSISEIDKNKYGINLPDTQQDYQDSIKIQPLKHQQSDPKNSVTDKKYPLPLIIQLQDDQFSTFLDQNRQSLYKDASIIINQTYLLKTNSLVLSMNSQFFNNAFSNRYKDGGKQIKLTLNSNNIVLFEIVINYLLLDKVIVPVNMGLNSWMELVQMTDYFCIERLKLICEQHISTFVNEFNSNEIMTFSLTMKMQNLSLLCADILLKTIVTKQPNYSPSIQTSLPIHTIYNLSHFDILQTKLDNLKITQDNIKKKISNCLLQNCDKQNHQTLTITCL